MRSNWIEHKGKKIFYQDFSQNFYNSAAVKEELNAVQKIVVAEPLNSLLVISDLRDTEIAGDLLTAMNAASRATKAHIRKNSSPGCDRR